MHKDIHGRRGEGTSEKRVDSGTIDGAGTRSKEMNCKNDLVNFNKILPISVHRHQFALKTMPTPPTLTPICWRAAAAIATLAAAQGATRALIFPCMQGRCVRTNLRNPRPTRSRVPTTMPSCLTSPTILVRVVVDLMRVWKLLDGWMGGCCDC